MQNTSLYPNDTTPEILRATLQAMDNSYVKGIKIAGFGVMVLVSLLANSLLFGVVIQNANHRTNTASYRFIATRACADILISLFSIVPGIVIPVQGLHWIAGQTGIAFCKVYNFSWIFVIVVSVGSMTAIAVDRFLLVFFPYKRIITTQATRAILACIVLTAVVFTSPLFYFSSLVKTKRTSFCQLHIHSFDLQALVIYLMFLLGLFLGIPLVVLLILYSAIAIKLWRRKAPGNRLPGFQAIRDKMNRKIVTMLVMIVVLFALCWLPNLIGNSICLLTGGHFCSSDAFVFMTSSLACANSAMNPCIYFVFTRNFRTGAKTVLKTLGCFRNGTVVAVARNRKNRVAVLCPVRARNDGN